MKRLPASAALVAMTAMTAGLLSATSALASDLKFLQPLPHQGVFGNTDVVLGTSGGVPQRVELFYNQRRIGTLSAPPWKFVVDTGGENIDRHFRAVALFASGELREAVLVLPRIRVDEVLDLPLRQLYVTATRGGDAARNLERGDFRIADGGERQNIVTFERGDAPLAALLLIDSSLSMRGEPLRAALEGARTFAGGMLELDEAMLLLFSDRVTHHSPFTDDASLLVSGLSAVEADGGSAINDHLFLALELLEARQGRRVAILLSDGVDVESLLPAVDVLELGRRSQAMVYWIRVATEPFGMLHRSAWRGIREHEEEMSRLAELVESSGGRRVDIASFEDAPTAFARILEELRQQYVLGYYPKRQRRDGSWRSIEVKTTSVGIDLRTRDGYYDD